MKYVPRILTYLRPYWGLALASVVLTVLLALAALLGPWPLKILVDSVLGYEPPPPVVADLLILLGAERVHFLIFAVGLGVGIALLNNGLTVLSNYVNTKLEQEMVLDFRSDLFKHAQRLSLAFHDERRAGGLIYAINFVAHEAVGLIAAIQPLAQSLLTLVGMFWVLLLFDVQLALLSLVVVPFLYYSMHYYATHIQARIRQVKGMEAETLSIIHEAISMLRVIVAFGRESHEFGRFRQQGERAVDARVRLTVRQTLFSLVVNMITAFGTALVVGFSAYAVLQGRLTVGQLLVAIAYLAAVYKPLESVSYTIGSLQDKFVALQMAYELRDTEPEIKDAPNAVVIERARGDIALETVCFSYKARADTLKDISFDVRAGQVAAIVGPTGAGKTTLMSLIPRFYDPQGGRVLLDGRDIRTVTVASLRAQISIVLQEPLLFSGTIADNIRYGRLDATDDEIVQAAEAANAHNFVMALPQKYDTLIGERGAQLSGGERQRIAVARAFLKDAPILILDEPTSAIDSRTEAVILDALDRLMVGRTTFMIAHRLSTVRHADLIVVLQHGQIVEQGTHDELMQRHGLYRQLYEAQIGPGRRRSEQILETAMGARDS